MVSIAMMAQDFSHPDGPFHKDGEMRLAALPGLSPQRAMAVYRQWLAEGQEEIYVKANWFHSVETRKGGERIAGQTSLISLSVLERLADLEAKGEGDKFTLNGAGEEIVPVTEALRSAIEKFNATGVLHSGTGLQIVMPGWEIEPSVPSADCVKIVMPCEESVEPYAHPCGFSADGYYRRPAPFQPDPNETFETIATRIIDSLRTTPKTNE